MLLDVCYVLMSNKPCIQVLVVMLVISLRYDTVINVALIYLSRPSRRSPSEDGHDLEEEGSVFDLEAHVVGE